MFGWFKNESKKEWGDYGYHWHCQDCDVLQEHSLSINVCPKCGSENVSRVIARFLTSIQPRGMMCERVTQDREIKKC